MKTISESELARRKKISAAVKKRYENIGERERVGTASKQMWQKPGYRENMAKKVNAYWETPGAKEKQGVAIKDAFQHLPEARKKQGNSMKALWDNPEYRDKMKKAMEGKAARGSRAGNWKGGRKTLGRGYIKIMAKNHPYADARGYVLEGRLVVERAIGRYLKPTEVVHHVNGITGDNRNRNLVACQDQGYHNTLHRRARELRAKE